MRSKMRTRMGMRMRRRMRKKARGRRTRRRRRLMERKKIDANGLVNSILLNCLRSFMRPTIKMRMRMRNMRMRMTKRRKRARRGRRRRKRRWLMVRRKIDVNGLANSMLSNLVVTFYEIEDEDKDGDEDEYEGENEEEGEREEESEEANGEEENRCKRFENHRPLDPIWAPRECDQEFRASRGPPWAVHPSVLLFGRPCSPPPGLHLGAQGGAIRNFGPPEGPPGPCTQSKRAPRGGPLRGPKSLQRASERFLKC